MKSTSLILAALLIGVATPGLAAERAGVKMPDVVSVSGKALKLNGLGVREATIMKVDVYVAGLYLEQPSHDPAAILASPQSKMLHLHFVRDVDRDDIVEAWSEGFRKNAGPQTKQLAPRIAQLNGWMTDVDKGQSLTFTFVPGVGTKVAVNGKLKGTIPGDDFARAMYSIWLGPEPPNSGLKTGLLGR
jgi:hypothetical protein